MNTPGKLYIVATPIGNLQDITHRALAILQHVDVIAAEDTRHSRTLLQQFAINTALLSLHEHNEQQRSKELIEQLRAGKNIALISDAGTPLISDPGYQLVQAAQLADIVVVPIPGPCAIITALCAAGLPTNRFCFEGFLSAKSSARKQALQTLQHETRTLIFYESPHRILATITDMKTIFGADRPAVIARELTKAYETIHAATFAELLLWLQADANQQRGEFVILVHGAAAVDTQLLTPEHLQLLKTLLVELPIKQAVRLAMQITGINKNLLYTMALALKSVDEF